MSDELETPAAVVRLAVATRADLERVRSLFVEGAKVLEGLEDALRVLPSSQSRIRGWRNLADNIVANIAEEQADVSRKLLGEGPVISENVDADHAEKVVALRREA